MIEYQVVVAYNGVVLFMTCWHFDEEQTRHNAWLLAEKLGTDYSIKVAVRKAPFRMVPWDEF